MPFWQLTSEQDWELCEAAQNGVNSSHYVPGPFSTYKEYNVDAFVRWCLHQLSRELTAESQEPDASRLSELLTLDSAALDSYGERLATR